MSASTSSGKRRSAVSSFILYSTLLMLFSDRMFFPVGPVNIYVAYLIVVTNLVLLWGKDFLWLPRGLLVFLGLIFLSGTLGLVRGTGSAVGFVKDISGIVPNAIYACAFIRFVHFDVEWFFDSYARFASWVAILGILFLPFQMPEPGRLTSVMAEPSSFCVACVPALLYYADRWQRIREGGWRFVALLFAVLLTISSVGFMGILFALYLFGTRYRFGKLVAPVAMVLAGLLFYTSSEYFRIRLNDTLISMQSADVSEANLSSYGVAMSFFVTERVVAAHPLIGGGLGSYVNAHDLYAPMMPGNEIFEEMGMGQLARWDASSLFLRIAAEFGLMGVVAMLWYLWYFFPKHSTPERKTIALCLILYLFLKFLRSGVYFNPEEWLFFVTYAVNGMRSRFDRRRAALTMPSEVPCGTTLLVEAAL